MSQSVFSKIMIVVTGLVFTAAAFAADETLKEYTLVIKGHKFEPAALEIPANTKIKLIVDNQDPTPEEFESHDLDLEKVIPGNSKATFFVEAQEAGEYKFFGEFNEATAQGKLIVK